MQKKINKIICSLFLILLIGCVGYIIYSEVEKKKQLIAYDKKIYFMDTYIYLKVYSNDSKKAEEALEGANNIYKKYHELADRYNGYPGCNNLYYIYHNEEDSEWLELDSRLYDLLEYSLSWYEKSDGLFDVRIGNVIDVWKKHKEEGTLPSDEELENATITNIILEDGKIKNNHPSIDLGAIAKGYATEKVGEYLESVGINEYILNAGGNVLVGKHYGNDAYKIGIEDPLDENAGIFIKVKANEKAVVTSGGYQRFFEVDGKRYSHIINPKTNYPSDQFLSVSVIASSSTLGDVLSTVLFMMSLEDGMALVNSMEDVEAIWYVSESEQVMSEHFNDYTYD